MTSKISFLGKGMLRKIQLLLVIALTASCALAQDVTASITGVVRDASGAVVPNATVRALNLGTNAEFTTTTNAEGQYTIRTMPVGEYKLSVEATGFRRNETSGIRLQVNDVARVDPTLDVGGTTETVTVSTQVVSVDTDTSSLRTVVDQKRIEELPLNGRNATQLMRLVAGVTADPKA